MVLAAAMPYGTPEQKQVADDQLNKLATADAQVSGKDAADLAADLAAKLASTIQKKVVKEELVDNDDAKSKPNILGHGETEKDVFVSTL